jgi:putative peptide maturation system protein
MKPMLSEALNDTLEYLQALAQEKIRPAEAKARLRAIQGRYPEMPVELLWEEESFDRSVHYDALLGLAGEGTVSLGFCPERAVPWPARGVHRWDEATLLRVNRTFLKVDEAVACLDFIWDQAPVIKRLVNRCLVQEELEKSLLSLTPEELQEAMDAFRRTRRFTRPTIPCAGWNGTALPRRSSRAW